MENSHSKISTLASGSGEPGSREHVRPARITVQRGPGRIYAKIAHIGRVLQECALDLSERLISIEAAENVVRLVIENREPANIQVFVSREGARILLGTFGGLETRAFTIASWLTGTPGFTLVAMTRTGTQTVQSPLVSAHSGQNVFWRVEHASFGRAIMVR